MEKKNKGFTLVELVVVIVVIGIVGVMVARQFSGGMADVARAHALYQTASKLHTSWTVLTQFTGTSMIIPADQATHALIDTGGTVLNVLFEGDNVTPAYQDRFEQSGVRPLRDAVTINTDGDYFITGIEITDMTTNGNYTIFSFANVPNNMVEALWSNHATGTLEDTATTTGTIRPGVLADGVRSLDIAFYN